MEKYTIKGGKKLRYGYTTGSCASAAATAAVQMLVTGSRVMQVRITLPQGDVASFIIEDIHMTCDQVSCCVTKDGGDDPDATHGAKIYATVTYAKKGISILGGEGVGVVTAKGLQCPVGTAAINPVPRKMITENVQRILTKYKIDQGVSIVISVPGGEAIAKNTFNPRLGIQGGISILGTTGIVDPMSEKALIDTIKAVVDSRYADDTENILIAPGNYGKDFCKEYLQLDISLAVPVSNYIGEALDYIGYKGFSKILLVGHTGKLIKLAAGIMNTHSSYADGRMEVIGAHSGACGADAATIEQLLNAVTTDEAFDLICDKPYYEQVKTRILEKAMYHLRHRLKNGPEIQVVMFTSDRRHIIKSQGADAMIELFKEDRGEWK